MNSEDSNHDQQPDGAHPYETDAIELQQVQEPAPEAVPSDVATPYGPADCAVVVGDHVLATVPDESGRLRTHRLVLLSGAQSGGGARVVAEVELDEDDVWEAQVTMTPHPVEPTVVVEFAMGQDGGHLLAVDVDGDRLRTTVIETGGVATFGGFSASGTRALLLPWPGEPEIRVCEWPGMRALATTTEEAHEVEMGWGLVGGFVDGDRVLVLRDEQGLLLLGPDLASGTELVLSPPYAGRDADVTSVTVRDGVIETLLWGEESGSETAWWSLPTSQA